MKYFLLCCIQVGIFPVLVVGMCPSIVSRAQWGAAAPRSRKSLSQNPPPYVVIHHSDTPPCTTEAACKSRVKNIQHYHMNNNHWDDIGYNFLIGGDGKVYEGRGWGISGAHAPSYNSKSIGVCLIGNFMNAEPPESQMSALRDLLACGSSSGKLKSNYNLIGHRQAKSTSCPGDKLYAKIKTLSHYQSNP